MDASITFNEKNVLTVLGSTCFEVEWTGIGAVTTGLDKLYVAVAT